MRILILDDDKNRVNAFQTNSGLTVKHVLTRKEFIDAIKEKEPYDLIMLDHDLGEEQERHQWSGLAAAKMLAGNRNLIGDSRQVIIHSANPCGAANMMAVMAQYEHLIVNVVMNAWDRVTKYSPETGLTFRV